MNVWKCDCGSVFPSDALFRDHWGRCPKMSPADLPIAPAPGRKDDLGKPRYDLLPPKALKEVVQVLTHGAGKYAPENWRQVEGWRWRYMRAGFGHLWDWWGGEKVDKESGLPHLAHAICSLMFLLELDRE